jgi:hypothetical protein
MSFKFLVGQAVEYTPVGGKTAEAYERNVLECQLSSNVLADSDYTMTQPRRSQGSHRR